MAGNEKEVAKILVLNKQKIKLKHLGLIKSVGAPAKTTGSFIELNSVQDVDRLLSSEDSRKKADIYINNVGVSVKQTGSSFSFNRLQRANMLKLFKLLKFKEAEKNIERIDLEVKKFHNQELSRRNRNWKDFFSEGEFKQLTEFLMMKGAPNVGISSHSAELILEAPASGITTDNINVYVFDEYFDTYKDKFKLAIRRQWYGQASESEHGRARGLMRKPDNAPWVFNDVVGEPNIHKSGKRWRPEILEKDRKTVYFLMIEKER